MNTLEDRVRAATRAAADTVPPDSVPPLRLPREDTGNGHRWRLGFGSGWALRLTPLAAAAAVAVVVITVVTIGRTVREPATGSGGGITPVGPMRPGPPVSSYVASGRVPRYYVAIESHGNPSFNPSYAVVRATVTGAALATIRAAVPHGTVVAVTAAADDRTFVLDEQPWATPETNANQLFEPRRFYLVRLGASGRPGTPERLGVTVPAGELVTGLALSPDGSKLALAVEPDNVRNRPNLQQVRVYTLATGAVRTWSADGTIGFGGDDARSLSWADDERTLAFDWTAAGLGVHTGVWLLDTATGGGKLLADSREAVTLINQSATPLVPIIMRSSADRVSGSSPASASGFASPPPVLYKSPSTSAAPSVGPTPHPTTSLPYVVPSGEASLPLACQEDSIITPDGSLVVCGALKTLKTTTLTGSGQFTIISDVEIAYLEYSTATGKVARSPGHWEVDNATAESVDILWSNASGSVLIGVIPAANGYGRVGVISGQEFTPLPTQAASVSPDSGTW